MQHQPLRKCNDPLARDDGPKCLNGRQVLRRCREPDLTVVGSGELQPLCRRPAAPQTVNSPHRTQESHFRANARENCKHTVHTQVCSHVHGSIRGNGQEVETTPMSTS